MSRIVIINPHRLWFLRSTAEYFISRRLPPGKYPWLFQQLYAAGAYDYVTDGRSAGPFKGALRVFNQNRVDYELWKRINGHRAREIDSLDSLGPADVIFFFAYGNVSYSSRRRGLFSLRQLDQIASSKARKIAHISHFVYQTEGMLSALRRLGVSAIIADAAVDKSSELYRIASTEVKYSPELKVLPFRPDPRFRSTTAFRDRRRKIVATGTISHCSDPEFVRIYAGTVLQPLRKRIRELAELYPEHIDCLISDVSDQWPVAGEGFAASTWTDVKVLYDLFVGRTAREGAPARYFERPFTDVYNDYQAFVCPEEVGGLPAVGFVEGMACGSAYIGQRLDCYTELGMTDGQHYIAHDGSVEGIVDKFSFYKRKPHALEGIAQNGRELIRSIEHSKILRDIIAHETPGR